MGKILRNRKRLIILLTGFLLCNSNLLLAQETRWIDDIVVDSLQDGSTFNLCNTDEQIIQYFNNGQGVQYLGGQPAIDSLFFAKYQRVDTDKSGMIRIRFVVNCSGELGRFRVLSADLDYQPTEFPSTLISQLMQIAKSMNGWQPKIWKETKIDYYQNLIFIINQGELSNIIA